MSVSFSVSVCLSLSHSIFLCFCLSLLSLSLFVSPLCLSLQVSLSLFVYKALNRSGNREHTLSDVLHREHLFRRCDLPHVSCGVPTYLRHSQRPGAVSLLSAAAPFCHPREYVCQWALERVKGVTFGCPGCIEKSWAEKELGREVIVVETRSGARLQLFETLILDANVSTY